MRAFIIIVIGCIFLTGCAAPGSAIGRLGLNIRCDEKTDAPEDVRVFLAKDYGMGGLDRFFGKPEDYGRRDLEQSALLSEGRYRIEFPPVVYHIGFWLLPPLGAYPKKPPPPVYYLRFSGSEDEVYIVGFHKKEFWYRVFDRLSRIEKSQTEAKWMLMDGRYVAEITEGEHKTWFLEFTLKKKEANQQPEPMRMDDSSTI